MQAALAIELVEDQPHHLLSLLVGVEGQPAAGFAYIADRRVVEQLAAAGLVQSPLVHPEAQEVELGLAHDTLQTQEQTVVEVGRVVQVIVVAQQRRNRPHERTIGTQSGSWRGFFRF